MARMHSDGATRNKEQMKQKYIILILNFQIKMRKKKKKENKLKVSKAMLSENLIQHVMNYIIVVCNS